jgi:hypothetical protein
VCFVLKIEDNLSNIVSANGKLQVTGDVQIGPALTQNSDGRISYRTDSVCLMIHQQSVNSQLPR